jgi:hypothetical protein
MALGSYASVVFSFSILLAFFSDLTGAGLAAAAFACFSANFFAFSAFRRSRSTNQWQQPHH